VAGLPIAWLPAPEDVARLLRARTKTDEGEELGWWSDETRPTEDEVIELIATAAGDLFAAVDQLTPGYEDPHLSARSLCARRAAMLIELSYFPEQVTTAQSPYSEYRQQWDDGVAALIGALAAPPAGGPTYSVFTAPATLLAFERWAPEWWDQTVVNLPEPETTAPIAPNVPGPPEREGPIGPIGGRRVA
jgi:hypothetical protein